MNRLDRLSEQIIAAYLADPSGANRAELARVLTDGPPDLRAATLDRLLHTTAEQHAQLASATAPPLRVGVVVEPAYYSHAGGPAYALIKTLPGGTPSLSAVGPDLEVEAGDEVVLTGNLGQVVRRTGRYQGGEVGRIVRLKPDSSEVVIAGQASEELVLRIGAAVGASPDLRAGALVRYCRQLAWATDVELPAEDATAAGADDIPAGLGWADLGGLDDVKPLLMDIEELFLAGGTELARRRLRRRQIVIFSGRPGTGKTYASKILAASLRRRLGRERVAYVLISAAELLSPFVGQSEANIRAVFSRARGLAAQGRQVMLIWDEAEALFGTRGSTHGATMVDRTLTPTLLAELDGLAAGLQDFLMIAISNRPDLLDSALSRDGRLGHTIHFRGPDWAETESIFRVHLADREIAPGWDAARLAERAAAAIFTPQRHGAPAVAQVRMHDGRREEVSRADLVTGALIASAVERAAEGELLRARRGGPAGLVADDLHRALDIAFAGHAARLKPWNLVEQLDWLPDRAAQAVAVEPVAGRRLAPRVAARAPARLEVS